VDEMLLVRRDQQHDSAVGRNRMLRAEGDGSVRCLHCLVTRRKILPGDEIQAISYLEHVLTLPRLALPRLAVPSLAKPCACPRPAVPRRATPCQAVPSLA